MLNKLIIAPVFLILSAFVSLNVASQNLWDVQSFGATPDSSLISTSAFQEAIDSCFKSGGGVVYVPPGEYKIGTIVLKDNVDFHVEAGATIYASRDIEDYLMPLEVATRPIMIYANGARNISISGRGTIHGNSRRVYEDLREVDRYIPEITENARKAGVEMKRYYIVPPDVSMFSLVNCSGITVQDITLRESSFWTLHIVKSDHIQIRGIEVFSDLENATNADGIDINSCQNVTISDCIITTADDAIALKAWFSEENTENVVVTNCVLTSSSTALKIGTGTRGDFRHIVFSNCVIRNSNRGLSIVVKDGGTVEDVLFSDITIECTRRHFNWWGNADPIYLFLTQWRENEAPGLIRNVVFRNIIAHGMGTSALKSTEGKRIQSIKFENVQLWMKKENYLDKRADHAFYTSNVSGLEIDGLTIHWDDEDPQSTWKSALWLSETDQVELRNLKLRQGLLNSDDPVIVFEDVETANLFYCQAEENANAFLYVKGTNSRDILLHQIDWRNHAKEKLSVASEVTESKTIKLIP